MEKLLRILSELWPDVAFENAANLVDDGILDSFNIVSLVGELNANFDIEIGVQDLLPENFNSVETLWALVDRLQNEG